MIELLKQDEAEPSAYPPAPAGLSDKAGDLAPGMIWQRIEHYTAHRFAPREVVWFVEGPGQWRAPLVPAEVTKTEVWRGDGFSETDLDPSPMGGVTLPGEGPYRITATVGADNDPPETVKEAYRRLAEYMATERGKPGVRTESVTAGSVSWRTSGHEAADARAMMNSGAGDLLRPYRRP